MAVAAKDEALLALAMIRRPVRALAFCCMANVPIKVLARLTAPVKLMLLRLAELFTVRLLNVPLKVAVMLGATILPEILIPPTPIMLPATLSV